MDWKSLHNVQPFVGSGESAISFVANSRCCFGRWGSTFGVADRGLTVTAAKHVERPRRLDLVHAVADGATGLKAAGVNDHGRLREVG